MKLLHRVELFGHIVEPKGPVDEPSRYKYRHLGRGGQVSEGHIPVGFRSVLTTETGSKLYLTTRDSKRGIGPEFSVSWQKLENVISEFNTSLDAVWMDVMIYLEKKGLVTLAELEYLDADPFLLFGIEHPATQKALKRLQKEPILKCEGDTPTEEEWMSYLCMDPIDGAHYKWVIEAFAEVELTLPWTSYKGIGSIVCFTNSDTKVTTWRHPLYDYFRQLLSYCKTVDDYEDMLRIRIHRLLWSYEFHHSHPGADPEPLISPKQLQKLAAIFEIDLGKEGQLVRILKRFLKVFAAEYQKRNDISKELVITCVDTLAAENERWSVLKDNWEETIKRSDNHNIELTALVNGKVDCIECHDKPALAYCLECRDHTCHDCFDRLHRKGLRSKHIKFKLIRCDLCKAMPARLRCGATSKPFCHHCYAMKHIYTLTQREKDMRPSVIDYATIKAEALANTEMRDESKTTETEALADRQVKCCTMGISRSGFNKNSGQGSKLRSTTSRLENDKQDHLSSSLLGSQWHPFYDSSGIMYYYNFSSRIRMRGSLLDPSSSRSRDDDNDESDDEQTSSEEDSTVV